MENVNGSSRNRLQVDYASITQSEIFRELKPVIYVDGNSCCCISGPNVIEGIFGFGNSPQEAIEDWEKAYAKKQRTP